jgi:hypothetical protein
MARTKRPLGHTLIKDPAFVDDCFGWPVAVGDMVMVSHMFFTDMVPAKVVKLLPTIRDSLNMKMTGDLVIKTTDEQGDYNKESEKLTIFCKECMLLEGAPENSRVWRRDEFNEWKKKLKSKPIFFKAAEPEAPTRPNTLDDPVVKAYLATLQTPTLQTPEPPKP